MTIDADVAFHSPFRGDKWGRNGLRREKTAYSLDRLTAKKHQLGTDPKGLKVIRGRRPMNDYQEFELVPLEDLQFIKGIPFPADLKYRQLLLTGPPGCGKSRTITKIGGWPEEGYIDLTLKNWWRAQSLTFRPREVHLGFPFVGFREALAVFDEQWLEAPEPPTLDCGRILLPPPKSHFFSTDWRQRYVFEFLLPPAEEILKWRTDRSRRGSHPVDAGVNLEQVRRQIAVYREAALHFQRSGILTYIRDAIQGMPKALRKSGK